MGYTTDFWGEWTVTPPLKPEHEAYLKRFAETRRMTRDPKLLVTADDPLRVAVGLPLGKVGEFFVGSPDQFGQDELAVTNYNEAGGQPGLWCQWTPTDAEHIAWDEGEKFYEYESWIGYLVDTFLAPWGYELNGSVEWQGEDSGDMGRITITRNVINVEAGHVVYE